MATLEEAAMAFTQRFVADVAAGGAQMAWRRWPQQDSGAGIRQVIAFWMWPAAYAASTPPSQEITEEGEAAEESHGEGFWFELRHEREDQEPYPDGYAQFTIFIEGGKWMYSYAVELLVEKHADYSPTP